jgi:hypothetical protein
VPDLGFNNLYGTDVTAMKAIDKFPDQNPNPVLRVNQSGVLIYANRASALIVERQRLTLGEPVHDRADGRPILRHSVRKSGLVDPRVAAQCVESGELHGGQVEACLFHALGEDMGRNLVQAPDQMSWHSGTRCLQRARPFSS